MRKAAKSMSNIDKKQTENDNKVKGKTKNITDKASKKYSKKTKEERKQEMDQALETLEKGVKDVFT